MKIEQARHIVAQWVRDHFSDQKLAEVYAFNQDGKMSFYNGCACLLGVTHSTNLHRMHVLRGCPEHQYGSELHYFRTRSILGSRSAELAYLVFGSHRQAELDAILRAEMDRRDGLGIRRIDERESHANFLIWRAHFRADLLVPSRGATSTRVHLAGSGPSPTEPVFFS